MKKNKLYYFILTACFIGYLWLFFLNFVLKKTTQTSFTTCIIKRATGYPCPSCGTTRAVASFFHGEFINSILLNPFGIIVASIMIVCPVWIVIDLLNNKETFHTFYIRLEIIIKKRKVALFLITLVVLNWIWNFYKKL
jgi:Protein of unknown function (DUF2752)